MTELDINYIAENYAKMSDQELERVATMDGHGLRPEVLKILEQEIKKRNLNPAFLNVAIAQNKEYTVSEIENYSKILRALPCPICGDTLTRLNGTVSHTVKSFIIFTSYGTEPTIACPSCLDEKNNNAIVSTALLGWWGFPWGLLKTPLYIYRNIKAKTQNKVDHSNDTLLSYTLGHIGEIEIYKNNKEKLNEIIRPKNN